MIFDLQPKKQAPLQTPEWVMNGSEKVKKLFQAVGVRIEEIEYLISQNQPLTPSLYKIRKSSLCNQLGYSDSYINKHKDLNAFVEAEQRRLNRKIMAMEMADREKNTTKNKVSQQRRGELIKQVSGLRKALARARDEVYIHQLNHLIDSGLSEQQLVVGRRLQLLEESIDDLRKKNAQLRVNNQRLTKSIEVQLKINAELKSRLVESAGQVSRVT